MEKALELQGSPNKLDSVEGNLQRSLDIKDIIKKRSEISLYGVGGKRLTVEAGATLTGLAEGDDMIQPMVKAIAVGDDIYKYCSSCDLFLPLVAFTNRKSGSYGKDYTCRVCKRKYNGSVACKKKYRRYWKSPKGKAFNKKRWKIERDRRPLEHKARQAVYRAVDRGELSRPSDCPICGKKEKVEAHHLDYTDPLKISWCCRTCHRKNHISS